MAEKEFYTNLRLMGSTVVDQAGLQVSLTNDEREAVHQAYGGAASASNPLVTKTQFENDLTALRSGLRWRDPVDTLAAVAPATPLVGARYINTVDHLIYTCVVASDWGIGEVPQANWTLFSKDTDEEWTYDLETTSWVMRSSGSIPMATILMPGKVVLADNGEVAASKVVQGNDKRLVKGYYGASITNPTGTVTVTHNLASSKLLITVWGPNGVADVSIVKNVADALNKIDLGVNGSPASLDVYIVALP